MQLVLDAGALIAFERGDPALRARLAAARRLGLAVTTTAPVVGQVWRDGNRQVLLGRLLRAIRVDAPDEEQARAAGTLLKRTNGSDVVDALLALLAGDNDEVLTSDVGDLERLLKARRSRARVVRV